MKVRLGDICSFQSGGTPSKSNPQFFGGSIPWITTVALNNGVIDSSNAVEWVTDRAIQESAAKIVPCESILVGTRVGVGKVAINSVPISTSQDIVSLLGINTDIWDKKYLCKFILANNTFILSQARGATIKGIRIDTLSNLQVPVKALNEQRRIAAVLDKVSDLIAKRRAQLDKLDELVKARFVEMFGSPVSNTLGWNQTKLSEVTSKIGSGATPKGGKESYHSEGVSLIRSMNIHDGLFLYKDLAHITDEQARQLDNVAVEDQDVFINITGASVARSCIVPHEVLPARVNQHVAIIRCIQSQMNPIFASNMFINDEFKKQLLEIGESGGATRQAITKQQLQDLNIILPPLELQNKFATSVNAINQSKLTIQQSLDSLEILKKALMQEYFG